MMLTDRLRRELGDSLPREEEVVDILIGFSEIALIFNGFLNELSNSMDLPVLSFSTVLGYGVVEKPLIADVDLLQTDAEAHAFVMNDGNPSDGSESFRAIEERLKEFFAADEAQSGNVKAWNADQQISWDHFHENLVFDEKRGRYANAVCFNEKIEKLEDNYTQESCRVSGCCSFEPPAAARSSNLLPPFLRISGIIGIFGSCSFNLINFGTSHCELL